MVVLIKSVNDSRGFPSGFIPQEILHTEWVGISPQVRGVGSHSGPNNFKPESAEIASTKVQLHPNLTTCFEHVNVTIL